MTATEPTSISTAEISSPSSFACDWALEYVFEPANAGRTTRPTRQKNKFCSLVRDEFEHVYLAFTATAGGRRGNPANAKSAKKFALEGNIDKLYTQAANEGKVTLQLRKPKCTIYIQPSTEQLRADKDAGKDSEPLKNVGRVKSLIRRLQEIQRRGRHADILLTLSEDDKSI
jgi:hypothetical protein